jgi:hypothetical protein
VCYPELSAPKIIRAGNLGTSSVPFLVADNFVSNLSRAIVGKTENSSPVSESEDDVIALVPAQVPTAAIENRKSRRECEPFPISMSLAVIEESCSMIIFSASQNLHFLAKNFTTGSAWRQGC